MSSTSVEIEAFIRSKTVIKKLSSPNNSYLAIAKPQAWEALPPSVQGQLGNNPKEYDKAIGQFSIRNQLR